MNKEEKEALYKEYKANLEKLEAKKDGLTGEMKEKYEGLRDNFSAKLEAVKDDAEESVDDARTHIEMAWKALKDTFAE